MSKNYKDSLRKSEELYKAEVSRRITTERVVREMTNNVEEKEKWTLDMIEQCEVSNKVSEKKVNEMTTKMNAMQKEFEDRMTNLTVVQHFEDEEMMVKNQRNINRILMQNLP